MPAALPEESVANNTTANPAAGRPITYDLLSGPKNSPLDARKFDYSTGTPLGWNAATKLPIVLNDPTNASTGALSTGIGFGPNVVFGAAVGGKFGDGNFTDDYIPGADKPDATAVGNSTAMYIGGGKSNSTGAPVPYTAGFGIGAAGNTLGRDAGAGPAFTGNPMNVVTTTGSAANAAAMVGADSAYKNYSGVTLAANQSTIGVGAASAAPAMADAETPPPVEEEAPPAPAEEDDEPDDNASGTNEVSDDELETMSPEEAEEDDIEEAEEDGTEGTYLSRALKKGKAARKKK